MKASKREAGEVGRRIDVLLQQGAFAEAQAFLREWIGQKEKPVSPFEGFAYLREVPLALSEMDPNCRVLLEEAGYLLVGHVDEASDEELCSIELISTKRLKRIRDAIEEVAGRYVEWRVRQE